jgi:ketosteroid isomerase-like protein
LLVAAPHSHQCRASVGGAPVGTLMGPLIPAAYWKCPADPSFWGSRFVGKSAVREGLRGRFTGIPDVHYSDDEHLVVGDVGVSKWTLRGTSSKGERIEVCGCDFYTFRAGKIVEKDSYWKIREHEAGGRRSGGSLMR